jgi:hypothetical protein
MTDYGTVVLSLHDATRNRHETPDQVRVDRADDLVLIAPELYDDAVAGGLTGVEAGEGMFVITASNGTWRYRLTGERDQHALVARLVASSADGA